ncbi:kinase family protein [Pelomyxa schiedti]|nr:kinase family protein [Pelomyxa schiedti]
MGDTALHIACRAENVEIVKQLLSYVGIDTNIKNKSGKTALECSNDDKVRQLFTATSTTTQRVAPPPRPASAPNKPPSPVLSPTLLQQQPTATTTRTLNTSMTCNVVSNTLEEGGDMITIQRNWEITAKQQMKENTELKARIRQLEEENARNLKQNEEKEANLLDLSARNKDLGDLIATLMEEKTDLKVVSTLGSGSYGTVFKCTFLPNVTATTSSSSSLSPETRTFVAVKALHDVLRSEFNFTQFRQEAMISSSLRHPNIVRCFGTCITSTGSLWIVSELMELSLRQLLHHKSLTFMEVVAVSSGIAKGMTALHMRNFMHRDLSSNNVLLDSCGIPKIADFGVSRALPSNGAVLLRTFTNGAGTPVYLSPQMHTCHYGIKGDMWEFAVLLSEILRGTTPEATVPKAAIQIHEFIRVQRTQLSPPEIAEVDRLCTDAGDYPVAECLSRRNAIIEALRLDPELSNVHPACVGQFSIVVESCLSILEINRPSFPVIERMLMTCAEIVFTSFGTSATNFATSTTTTSDNHDATAHITTCLANMAASFPGRPPNTHSSSS